jgi:hypothetical protein
MYVCMYVYIYVCVYVCMYLKYTSISQKKKFPWKYQFICYGIPKRDFFSKKKIHLHKAYPWGLTKDF